jgi:hypothetical protein
VLLGSEGTNAPASSGEKASRALAAVTAQLGGDFFIAPPGDSGVKLRPNKCSLVFKRLFHTFV